MSTDPMDDSKRFDCAHLIRELGRGREGARSLSRDEARQLFGAMLDGQVGELELGAIVLALRVKGESTEEMLGFLAAAGERLKALTPPAGSARPVVLPSYNGARKEANLTPLLAMALHRLGLTVLVHGADDDYGRVTTREVFGALDMASCADLSTAQDRLAAGEGPLLLPLPVLSPGLAALLALRRRLGLRNSAHSLVKLLDPFAGQGLLLACATHPDYLDAMRAAIAALPSRALLFRGTEGEPYANPRRCPRIEYLHDGMVETLVEAERDSLKALPALPAGRDPETTAAWTRRVLTGDLPMPAALAAQLACCLLAAGRFADLAEARNAVAAAFAV